MKKCRFVAKRMVAVILVLTTLVISTPLTFADVSYNENLLNTLTNFNTGNIGLSIEVPANTTVNVTAELDLNSRFGSIGRATASYRNNTSQAVSKRLYLNVNYLGDYRVTASYTKFRTTYKDTDTIRSGLVGTVYSDKFVWNQANINKYNADATFAVVFSFACSLCIDAVIKKLAATTATATFWAGVQYARSAASLALDASTAGGAVSTRSIQCNPIVGWGYKIKLTPTTNGFSKTLFVYDEYDRLYTQYYLGNL